MKKSELFFNAFLVPLDYLMIVAATLLVYLLRFYFNPIVESYPLLYSLPFQKFLEIVLISALVVVIVFAIEGLYSMKVTRSLLKEFIKIVAAASTALVIFIIIAFLDRELLSSRFIFLGSWFLVIILVAAERTLARLLQRKIAKWRGTGIHRVLIIGKNEISDKIIHYLHCHQGQPYRITGRLVEFDESKLLKYKDRIDEVIQCDPTLHTSRANQLARFCELNRIDFKYVPNLFAARATNIEIRTLAGFPVVEIKRTPLDGWGRIIKRLIDLVISTLMLIILSPVFLVFAILIKLDSTGPVFFRMKRISQGKEFRIYKFRSMVKNAKQLKKELLKQNERKDGPLFKLKNDPRVTKFGRFLRRTRWDEFAQLINVFKGEMSLVGPRPHELEEIAQYEARHHKVLAIKSGITGLAQVSGSSKLSFEDEVGLDTYYIENWSLRLDFVILAKTFLIFLTRDKNAC
jgi:exopolysaccharide biosynthesis polyprenyl glycosylphosphotransferase